MARHSLLKNPMILGETPRLIVRHFLNTDAEFIIRLLNEPSFIQNIADKGIRTTEDAISYLRKGPLASYTKFGFGLNLVELKDSATPIGMCGLLQRENLDDPDIGYAFLPEFWSKGYATESLDCILSSARQAFGLQRVLAVTKVENHASIRLLEKSGFKYREMVKLYTDEPKDKLFVFDF